MTASKLTGSEIVQTIRERGLCCVPDVFSGAECRDFCEILETVAGNLRDSGRYFGSSSTQVIYNYFAYDERTYPLLAHPLIEQVMTALIDDDYVLVSPSARNPRISDQYPGGRPASGEGWHVDSRVADPKTGALFQPSMSFYAVIALEPFRRSNSATHYLPESHLRYQRPPDRNAELSYEVMEAGAGSIVFFDSALWHRTGAPSKASRWSIFNMYGPWFMKPYFRFSDEIDRVTLERMPTNVQKLLHLCSTPPRNPDARLGTITPTAMFD
ncbi:MAG: phytanoyl-CoA dioxygenase family protein [Pseudomonadota bacterium]